MTGATRGIGRELVLQLCRHGGYQVVATGRDALLLESLATESGCKVIAADLSVPEECTRVLEKSVELLGGIDVLVNNAGLNHKKQAVADIELDAWELQYAVNLRAPMLLCQGAMRIMSQQKSGHIINVVSTITKVSQPNYATYTTMKSGLAAFTKVLMKEGQQVNVKVTNVSPGGTNSDFREVDRPDYMHVSSAASMILHCMEAPPDVIVHELTFRPPCETNY